jgi:hypothetical protein
MKEYQFHFKQRGTTPKEIRYIDLILFIQNVLWKRGWSDLAK